MLLRGNDIKYPRESGILLHISSLPSDFGIGSMGFEAYRFVDFLKKCGQTYWQILPICPVGKGNSPYSSVSSFAGEMLLIDIQLLVNDKYLSQDDIKEVESNKNTDYKLAREIKIPLIKKATENFNIKNRDFIKFQKKNEYWLSDYALFMAIKEVHPKTPLVKFEDSLKYRIPIALEQFKKKYSDKIMFYKIVQYFFYSQYFRLKNYASESGIKIIGDIPFYVSPDSADVWSNPDIFRLGRDLTPVLVAGVPPDIFSSEGQLWGNPIYDWDYQKKTNYNWWKKRLIHNSELFDVIRIDHFRAFADYYTIPYGSKNAKSGTWEHGVGIAFWELMKDYIKSDIIAEDLGGDTPEVEQLIEDTEFPNMKILQFAFSSDLKNPFIPKNYSKNCVCYTGTHDNDTTLGWYSKSTQKEKIIFSRLVPPDKTGSEVLSLISYGMKSKARIVIIPLQDYLCLDSSCRMNSPGISYGNWEWRFLKTDLNDELCNTIKRLSKGRN